MDKYLSYFDEVVHENQEDIITICESASRKIYDQVGIKFGNKEDDAKLIGVIFSKTYESIISVLKKLEATKSNEVINFCNRFNVGFSTSDNEDDEKQGNFMFFMTDLGKSHKDVDMEDSDTSTQKERAIFWNMENAKENPEVIRDIGIEAIKKLDDEVDVKLESWEFIPPFFSIVYDAIVNYVKIKRREADEFEFEIYFMSCFYIGARETEDDADVIYITPNIDSKLSMKDDLKASSKND